MKNMRFEGKVNSDKVMLLGGSEVFARNVIMRWEESCGFDSVLAKTKNLQLDCAKVLRERDRGSI